MHEEIFDSYSMSLSTFLMKMNGYLDEYNENEEGKRYQLLSDEKKYYQASTIDSGATVSGVGTVNLTTGANKINVVVTAPNKTTRTYVLNIIRQNGGPVYSSGVGGISTGPGVQAIISPTTSAGTTGSGTTDSSQPVIKIDTPVPSSGSTQQSSKTKPTVVLIGPGGQ